METNPQKPFGGRQLAGIAAVAVVYALLAKLMLAKFAAYGFATVFWPASGVALAAVLLGGRLYAAGVFLGALAGLVWAGSSPVEGAAMAAGSALEPLIGFWLLTRKTDFDTSLRSPRDFFRLFVIGGIVSPAIGALAGGGADLLYDGVADWRSLSHWWMGDMLGVLVVTPLVLVWRQPPQPRGWQIAEGIAVLAASVLLGQMVLLGWLADWLPGMRFGYWMFLPVTWTAVRLGLHGVLLVLLATIVQALVGASNDIGYFSGTSPAIRSVAFWAYEMIVSIVGLSLAVVLAARRHAEEALRRSEAQYRAVTETAADGFWIVDEQARILAVNEAYVRRSGYSREELLRMRIFDLDAVESPAQTHTHVEKVRRDGADLFETRHRSKHGEVWPVEVNTAYWAEAGGRYFVFLRDIGERKRVEAAFQESEARFRAIFEQAAVGIAVVATDGRFRRANAKLCEIFGYAEEELTQKTFRDITYKDDLAIGLAAFGRLLSGELPSYVTEKRYVRRDGYPVWCTLAATLVRHPDGSPAYLVSVVEDISERKRSEAALLAMRSEMDRISRFQVASQTVAAIAHQLNQPLNAVTSYNEAALRMLRAGNPKPDRLIHALEGSNVQAQRAGAVVRELLVFMRAGKVETAPVDINELVRDVAARIEVDGYRSFDTRLDLAPSLPAVLANRLQIEKVLVNLMENSIDAMREAGADLQAIVVTVRTAAESSMVQVTVADSGPGVSAEAVARVFDAFFTTKTKGLGMGLAVSRAIVEAHGGQMWLDPAPDNGAVFHFTLPFAS